MNEQSREQMNQQRSERTNEPANKETMLTQYFHAVMFPYSYILTSPALFYNDFHTTHL